MADSLFVDETPPGSPYDPDQLGLGPDVGNDPAGSAVDAVDLASQVQSSYDAIREACRARDEQLVPKLPLLPFVTEIVRDLLLEDHLAVFAKGLGLYQAAAALIAVTDAAGTQRTATSDAPIEKESLVLVIGASKTDTALIESELARLALADLPTRGLQTLTAETSAAKRTELYNAGGVYAVTTRILVVDMLTNAIPVPVITGIIVLNADRVDETSNEAFILRLLRAQNPHAFIKALSDQPTRVSPGINGLSMRLRSLGVAKVALWPRFHVQISDCLGTKQMSECIIGLSESMKMMQALVSELLQACISDIKRRVPGVDTESWTVDAAMKTDLVRTVRMTLYSHIHRLSYEGQQSVEDLGVLQALMADLTRCHPVELVKLLDTLWAARLDDSRSVSAWLLLPQAEALRELANERMAGHEVLPKLEYLRQQLDELPGTPRVLVVVADVYAAERVQRYIDQGGAYIAALEREYHVWKGRIVASPAPAPAPAVPDHRAKRRRVRGTGRYTEGRVKQESPDADVEAAAEAAAEAAVEAAAEAAIDAIELVSEAASDTPGPLPFRPVVVTHAQADVLYTLDPDVIIVYDLSMEFTRAIEMYRATTKREPDIYFLYYQNSVEEMRYLTDLRQEKDAFPRLIHEKGTMPMVIIDPEEVLVGNAAPRFVSTRIGGRVQARVVTTPPRVVVDVREFRSSLPFLLWQGHIDVVPLTLMVGDYIVTPEICVERKTVADLLSSFADGRLYTQCEQMFRHYKRPVLLIEFGNDKAFSLEPFREIRAASAHQQSTIHGNLATLLVKFPRLKLVWSASPRHTAEIFASLKLNADEPDPVQCVQTGQEVVLNETAQRMLTAIPGVTPALARLLMARVPSLAALVEMDVADLQPIVGREAATKMVRFMRAGE